MDLSAIRARAEELMANVERMRAEAGEVRDRVRAVTAKATSDDGYVTAVVDPRGRLQSLTIDPRVYRRPDSHHLAESIVQAVRKAAADADRQVEKALGRYVSAADLRAQLDVDLPAMFRKFDEELDALPKGDSS